MKKSFLRRMAVLAVVLCLATTSLMSGTLAKYTTTVAGTGTTAVAKWSFKAGETTTSESETFSFTLADTKMLNSNVAAVVVAPGDKGDIEIRMDAKDSQVGVNYSISIDKTGLSTTGAVIKFYSDAEMRNEITSVLEGTIEQASVGTPVSQKIYWQWVTATDAADTTLGTSAASETFTVTVTGTQKIATT